MAVLAQREEWLMARAGGIWQRQPQLASGGRSYSLGRTADASEAACGLTAPLNFIVCKYCRDWNATDLRTLAASRVGWFVPRVVLFIITQSEENEGASLMLFSCELLGIVQSRVRL